MIASDEDSSFFFFFTSGQAVLGVFAKITQISKKEDEGGRGRVRLPVRGVLDGSVDEGPTFRRQLRNGAFAAIISPRMLARPRILGLRITPYFPPKYSLAYAKTRSR